MKNALFIVLIFIALKGATQSSITIGERVICLDSNECFTITKVAKYKYAVKDLSGNDLARLTIENYHDKTYFKGEFAPLGMKYETNYVAGTTIDMVLKSYYRYKIIVDRKIDSVGLQNYCNASKVKISRMFLEEEHKLYNDSLKKKDKKFSFGIQFGLAQSFRDYPEQMSRLSFLSPWGYQHGQSYQFQSSSVKGELTSNLGLRFEFLARKNVFLSLGLNYTKLVYQTRDSVLCYTSSWSQPWYTATNTVDYDTVDNFMLREEYYFASLPVHAFYRLNHNNGFYTFGGGASFAVLFRSITVLNYGMAGWNGYEYKPVIVKPILFAKAGVFGNIGERGSALGLEMELKFYGKYSRHGSKAANFLTLGSNLVLSF